MRLINLPPDTKISITLDCWTSPFQQTFLETTGYFIDDDWNYREMVLGFEPLHGTHSGVNLSAVLFVLLQQYEITVRLLAITTDNVSNNLILMEIIQDSIQSSHLGDTPEIILVPCIARNSKTGALNCARNTVRALKPTLSPTENIRQPRKNHRRHH
jgi:hypothetical protein